MSIRKLFLSFLLSTCLLLAACADEPGNLALSPPEGPRQQAHVEKMLPQLVNGVGIEFVRIPHGDFLMGLDDTRGGFPDETPEHLVTIHKPFYIGRYEVTQAQWEVVMGSNPSYYQKGALPFRPSALNFMGVKEFTGDSNPVENVSWDDANFFIERLNQLEGKSVYRLPTEAEWEYAARAGDKLVVEADTSLTRWPAVIIWFNDGVRGMPMPVGRQAPNAWGLHDMEGNVREWCQDYYSPEYYRRSPTVSPQGAIRGDMKVNRGGCWYDPMNLRLVQRYFNRGDHRSPFIGFRLVREVD